MIRAKRVYLALKKVEEEETMNKDYIFETAALFDGKCCRTDCRHSGISHVNNLRLISTKHKNK